MTRVTIEQLGKILPKLKDNPEELRAVLKYYFSFDCNIDTFSKFFFPDFILNNVPDFHKDFYFFLLAIGNGALAAPRGHAKSTIAGLVFIIWCIVNKKEKYIVYVSQNHTKTVQFITPIRWQARINKWLHFVYGDLTPKRIKDDLNKDREDCVDILGCRVEAVSFEKNLRGFKTKENLRPTLIIGDDIEDDQRILNPLLRKKDTDKLNKIIIPSLDIDGRFKMIGTILHLDSLLMKKIKTYNGKIFTALNDKNEPLWAERFTMEKLKEIKKDIGSVAFQQEYMNNPVDNETCVIKPEWVRASFDYDFDLKYEDMDRVYLGVDFAFEDRVTSDESAFDDIGVKGDKKYMLNIRWEKGKSLPIQMDITRDLHAQRKYYTIAFEENSIKGYTHDIRQLGLPIKMFWTGSRDEKDVDRIKRPSDTKSYSKENAISRLAVEFENGMWVIPYKTESQKIKAERLLAELTSWGREDGKIVELGVHPDAPIGMLLVNEVLSENEVVIFM